MCFGDKKSARSASPGAMPVLKFGSRSSTPAMQQRTAAPPAKLTKTRPPPVEIPENEPSFDITWPLDRPEGESDVIIYQPSSPDTLDQPPTQPYRYDDASVPPSRAASVYSRTPSLNDFTLPEKPLTLATPPRPARPASWLTESPLTPLSNSNPPNFSRPTSPPPALPPSPLRISRPAPLPPLPPPSTITTITADPAPTPEKRTVSLARSLSAKIASRPKFSLPENLAPFSMPPAPIMKDLYLPPTPPPPEAPPVPERNAPMERVFSQGRIAIDDDLDATERVPYEKVRLFPIPDSIINSEAGYVEAKQRSKLAAALAERAREKHAERIASLHSRGQPSVSSNGSMSHASSGSYRDSVGSEEYDYFDSRCPSRANDRPASMLPLAQLQSRFSMSSLGSTIREQASVDRPQAGGMPTFPSRHEAKKARKIWLQQQEEAKRQSAKMGVEGILGWDANRKQWVTKMSAEEMRLWLEQWKKSADEKNATASVTTGRVSPSDSASSSSASSPSEPKSSLDNFEVKIIRV